jgi:cell wall-associated NlpC family hydrolase
MLDEERRLRDAIVAEAYSFLKTPYHHQGMLKGVGVDCVTLLILVYRSVGIVDVDFDPGNYSAEWYFHRHEEIYMGGVERYAHRVEVGELGDVALYQHGRCVSHGAIIVGDGLIIHASRPDRQVELCEMRTHADKFHSYWSAIP